MPHLPTVQKNAGIRASPAVRVGVMIVPTDVFPVRPKGTDAAKIAGGWQSVRLGICSKSSQCVTLQIKNCLVFLDSCHQTSTALTLHLKHIITSHTQIASLCPRRVSFAPELPANPLKDLAGPPGAIFEDVSLHRMCNVFMPTAQKIIY